MTKVVYSKCYGGFCLSPEACQRYWELQGKEVWIEHDSKYGSLGVFTVWLVPPEERVIEPKNFDSMTMEERVAYNKKHSEQTWYDRDISRHDPILVQVVEEMGDKANGPHARLAIEEVFHQYRIEEYDGNETVVEPNDIDWINS
jgi:hypothetical protein